MHLMMEIWSIINNYDTRIANKLKGMSQYGFKYLLKSHPDFDTHAISQDFQNWGFTNVSLYEWMNSNANSYGIGSNCEYFPNLETRYALDI